MYMDDVRKFCPDAPTPMEHEMEFLCNMGEHLSPQTAAKAVRDVLLSRELMWNYEHVLHEFIDDCEPNDAQRIWLAIEYAQACNRAAALNFTDKEGYIRKE